MDARTKILEAFRDLVLSERFDDFSIQDVVEQSGVARSTFYQHFQNKNDLLIQSILPILNVLAEACNKGDDHPGLEEVLNHLWQNRALGQKFFEAPISKYLVAAMVKLLSKGTESQAQNHFVANGVIGTIGAWLAGHISMPQSELTKLIYKMAR